MTTGEYRVGINFNPSGDDLVGKIKRQSADLIDIIDAIPVPEVRDAATAAHSNQVARLRSLAQTAIEEGAMWAVKAATKPPMVVKNEGEAE